MGIATSSRSRSRLPSRLAPTQEVVARVGRGVFIDSQRNVPAIVGTNDLSTWPTPFRPAALRSPS